MRISRALKQIKKAPFKAIWALISSDSYLQQREKLNAKSNLCHVQPEQHNWITGHSPFRIKDPTHTKVLIDLSSSSFLFQYQLKASSTLSGSFRFCVSGSWQSSSEELKERIAKIIRGRLGEYWIKRGVKGAIMLPSLPITEHIEKNRWRRLVGKTSTV